MRVIKSPQQLQKICLGLKRRGQTMGLVPTMGALHEGHLSLLKAARKKADVVILTLFVNPAQFGPKEDFKKYPRTLKADLKKAKKCGTDLVFLPTTKSIYPDGYETTVEVTRATRELCSRSRPGHFRGVTTIVAKLFILTLPDWAFFGKKDFQQVAVIKRMTQDLNLLIQIIGLPTVREKDGMAMSSRNVTLNPQERRAALCLSRSLRRVRKEVKRGPQNIKNLLALIKKEIRKERLARIDYVSCVDAKTIQPISTYKKGKTLFALAVFIGKTRLIDNMVV